MPGAPCGRTWLLSGKSQDGREDDNKERKQFNFFSCEAPWMIAGGPTKVFCRKVEN